MMVPSTIYTDPGLAGRLRLLEMVHLQGSPALQVVAPQKVD